MGSQSLHISSSEMWPVLHAFRRFHSIGLGVDRGEAFSPSGVLPPLVTVGSHLSGPVLHEGQPTPTRECVSGEGVSCSGLGPVCSCQVWQRPHSGVSGSGRPDTRERELREGDIEFSSPVVKALGEDSHSAFDRKDTESSGSDYGQACPRDSCPSITATTPSVPECVLRQFLHLFSSLGRGLPFGV